MGDEFNEETVLLLFLEQQEMEGSIIVPLAGFDVTIKYDKVSGEVAYLETITENNITTLLPPTILNPVIKSLQNAIETLAKYQLLSYLYENHTDQKPIKTIIETYLIVENCTIAKKNAKEGIEKAFAEILKQYTPTMTSNLFKKESDPYPIYDVLRPPQELRCLQDVVQVIQKLEEKTQKSAHKKPVNK